MSEFAKVLNEYGKKRKPCFFLVDFDKINYHIEPLENPSGDVWYDVDGISYDAPINKYTCKDKIKKQFVSKQIYKKAFDNIIEEIKSGNTYLLNLTFPTKLEGDISFEEVFHASEAPFKCKYKDDFVCFSPERFVKIFKESIHTYPMKGTIKANIEDAENKIFNDKKEMAEHIMVVDLLRNDLSKVATHVCVERFRYIDKIKAGDEELLQVSSEISGLLPVNWQDTLGDIFDELLPAGSITGTPKKNTVKIIKNIELRKRNFYTGIFGVFDGESVDSAVMIRFIEKNSYGTYYKSGGGLTIDSQMKNEYEEMKDKVYVPMF